jgi:histidine kinase/histidine kinase/DNA gyrase B/HSP90-like ATPase
MDQIGVASSGRCVAGWRHLVDAFHCDAGAEVAGTGALRCASDHPFVRDPDPACGRGIVPCSLARDFMVANPSRRRGDRHWHLGDALHRDGGAQCAGRRELRTCLGDPVDSDRNNCFDGGALVGFHHSDYDNNQTVRQQSRHTISGLHYTGVAGFICTPTAAASLPLTGLSPSGLAPWVAGISLVFLWNVLIFGIYDRRLFARTFAENHRLDLLTVLTNTQEEERLRIARELHDQMGQDLIGLSLMLKSIEPAVQTDAARETLGQLQALTAEMDQRVHDIAWELRPSLPQAGGLRSLLESYVSDWSARFNIAVDFHAVGLDGHDLPARVETTVFRVVQEAFTNILKHAAATAVSLVVERGEDQLRVRIKDDGKGFDRDATMAP